jgi:hypothetical protein
VTLLRKENTACTESEQRTASVDLQRNMWQKCHRQVTLLKEAVSAWANSNSTQQAFCNGEASGKRVTARWRLVERQSLLAQNQNIGQHLLIINGALFQVSPPGGASWRGSRCLASMHESCRSCCPVTPADLATFCWGNVTALCMQCIICHQFMLTCHSC